MNKKAILLMVLVLSLLIVSGCGNGDPAPEQEETISIVIANNSEKIIISWAVFFGPNLEEWGEDLLGDELIEPGETYTFEMPEGTYDLSLLTYELYIIHGAWNISDDTRIEIGGNGLVPILVENNSDSDIALFYLSPSDSDDWGEDWLGSAGYIPAETGRRFFFVEPDTYDFLALSLEGERIIEVYELLIDEEKTIAIN